MSKHRSISLVSRLLQVNQNPTNRLKPHSNPPSRWRHSTPQSSPIPRTQNVSCFLPAPLLSQSSLHLARGLSSASTASADDSDFEYEAPRAVRELLAEVEREKAREKEAKKKAGINVDAEEEEEEDYMGVGPLIEKLEKAGPLSEGMDLEILEEPTDSDSDEEVNDEFQAEELGDIEEQREMKKIKRHEELMKKFKESDNLDDAHRWMSRIDRFEEKHFRLRPEYRVIGEMMNRFKVAAGKEKFLLAQKLNRALRLLDWKEQYDPEDSSNYGLIKQEQVGSAAELQEEAEFEKEKPSERGGVEENDLDEFDDMKERDDILLAKLNEIDQKLEEKLGELEYTFGKKGKLLEEEIRDLAEERNSLQEKKRRPLYRKGFDVRLIDVNRTCKVTKGGQIAKYTAILACGNYNGVVGYAKAKGPAIPVALQKAYEKCFQNLHYVDLYEDHTIAHAIQTTYKKTKVYLWPASTTTGMKAGRTVQTILNLAGFKNVKSKVIGSRNPHNTVKALFQALNAVESPKDVQEKFGRTVVESYLLESKQKTVCRCRAF